MSAPDAATLSIEYNITCDFALGYWWVNVYQEGWITPIASFGPCAGFGAGQAKQVQHEARNWLEKTLRAAIEGRMDSVVFAIQRNDTRGKFVTPIGLAKLEHIEGDGVDTAQEYKFRVPVESKYHGS